MFQLIDDYFENIYDINAVKNSSVVSDVNWIKDLM